MPRLETVPVEETPWWLEANGTRVASGTATPNRLEALAAGRLLADGYVHGADELVGLAVISEPAGCVGLRARVTVERMAAAEAVRSHREAHGCGARYFLACAPASLPAPTAGATVPPISVFPELFRSLYASAERYQQTGGMHVAALTDGIDLRYAVEDVGRHNAVDKTIGWAMLEGADRAVLGLILSARVSAEIAVKAARAGLAWIASRSIPTDLAVEIARAAGLAVVGRAAGKDARVFETGRVEPGAHAAPRPDGDADG